MIQTSIWNRNFSISTIVNLLLAFTFQMLMPTIPIYISELQGSFFIVGLIAAGGTITALLVRPVIGVLIDKNGRKGLLIVGNIIMLVTSMMYSWFPIIGIIFAIRLANGIGWGMSTTTSSTIATDNIPKHRMSEGLGFFNFSIVLPMALAPGFGIAIMNRYGFTFLTYVVTGLLFISVLLSIFVRETVKEDNIHDTRLNLKFDLKSAYERSAVFPSMITMLICIAFGAVFTFISLYAKTKGIEDIGMFFAVCAAAQFISRPIIGKLVDQFGFNIIVYSGILLIISSIVALSLSNTMVHFLLAALLFGIGFSASQASLQTMAIIHASPKRYGAANGTYFTGVDAGVCIGSLIAGMLVVNVGYSTMYQLTLIPLLIGLVIYLFMHMKQAYNSSISIKDT